MDMNFNENVDKVFARLEEFFQSRTVIGESITVGDATLIPVLDISIGLGLGGGDGVDDKGAKGVGGGGGAGAKGSATAVIVIRGDQIDILPIKRQASLEKLVEMVPEIVSRIREEQDRAKGDSEDKDD